MLLFSCFSLLIIHSVQFASVNSVKVTLCWFPSLPLHWSNSSYISLFTFFGSSFPGFLYFLPLSNSVAVWVHLLTAATLCPWTEACERRLYCSLLFCLFCRFIVWRKEATYLLYQLVSAACPSSLKKAAPRLDKAGSAGFFVLFSCFQGTLSWLFGVCGRCRHLGLTRFMPGNRLDCLWPPLSGALSRLYKCTIALPFLSPRLFYSTMFAIVSVIRVDMRAAVPIRGSGREGEEWYAKARYAALIDALQLRECKTQPGFSAFTFPQSYL